MNRNELKNFLDFKVSQYNRTDFIPSDPISIPHSFLRKEDIEISGFLTAQISWGNRKAIQKSANELMERLDNAPYDFIQNAGKKEFLLLATFYYRTMLPGDMVFFLRSLQNIYQNYGGLEKLFAAGFKINGSAFGAVEYARQFIFRLPHEERYRKHFPSPLRGSASKRIHMYLRWMCRKDNSGVDFGIWSSIPQSELMCPLDLHSGKVARKLGLLRRKQDDRKAVEELTTELRKFDPKDPVKYDFALFGLSVFKKF